MENDRYQFFSGPYLPVFELKYGASSTGKYGAIKTPLLETFHAVNTSGKSWGSKSNVFIVDLRQVFVSLEGFHIRSKYFEIITLLQQSP